jgi:hypothetical protein
MRNACALAFLLSFPAAFGCVPAPEAGEAGGGPSDQRRAAEVVRAHCGKDLQGAERAQLKELLGAVTALLPQRRYRDDLFFEFRPWHVWAFGREGGPTLAVLFEVNNSWPHPGSTDIRITAFDEGGRVAAEAAFTTGHRSYLRGAGLEQRGEGQYPLVALDSGPGPGPGPPPRKQLYALVGTRFDLVRLEGTGGEAALNDYGVRHFACGPAPPAQAAESWEADLLCGDRFRALRALAWLGGSHREPKAGEVPEPQYESAAEFGLTRAVRGRPKVVARLKELCGSGDRWLREAALLALSPDDDRH